MTSSSIMAAGYCRVCSCLLLKTCLKLNLPFLFLQNLAFQAEMKIKSQILNSLGTEQLFALLSDPNVSVLMKTLGLLRNLLSSKAVCTGLWIIYFTKAPYSLVTAYFLK